MKTISVLSLVLLTAVAGVRGADPKALPTPKEITIPEGVDPDLVREAGNKAIKATLADFMRQRDVGIKRFAVLPLQQDVDGGYFTSQLRNLFSTEGPANGYELYTRMDDEFAMLLKEIAWGQNYGDTMDAATVQKFGRIQGVQGLITGRLSSVSKYKKDDVKVRFMMQVFEVETGKLIWGEEKVAYGKRDAANDSWWADIEDDKLRYGLIALGGLVLLTIVIWLVRRIGAAARPR